MEFLIVHFTEIYKSLWEVITLTSLYTRKTYSIWSKEMCPENKSRHNPPFSSYRVRKSMLLWEELRCLIYPVCCCLCVWCSLWVPPLTLGGLAYVGFIKLQDTRRKGKINRERKKSVWVCAFFLCYVAPSLQTSKLLRNVAPLMALLACECVSTCP